MTQPNFESHLESHWVLERTSIGQTEIATRALKLPMMARAILLMVDGKSEVHQLQHKMKSIPENTNILLSLYNNGLIRRRHYSSEQAGRADRDGLLHSEQVMQNTLKKLRMPVASISADERSLEQASAPSAKSHRRSLALARLYLLDQMERMFGPRSDAIRNMLRTATRREDLLLVLADCREIIEETSGTERTERVMQEFYALLPEMSIATAPQLASSIQAP